MKEIDRKHLPDIPGGRTPGDNGCVPSFPEPLEYPPNPLGPFPGPVPVELPADPV